MHRERWGRICGLGLRPQALAHNVKIVPNSKLSAHVCGDLAYIQIGCPELRDARTIIQPRLVQGGLDLLCKAAAPMPQHGYRQFPLLNRWEMPWRKPNHICVQDDALDGDKDL